MSDEFQRLRSSVSSKKKLKEEARDVYMNVYPDFNFKRKLNALRDLPFGKKLMNQKDMRELNRFKREF